MSDSSSYYDELKHAFNGAARDKAKTKTKKEKKSSLTGKEDIIVDVDVALLQEGQVKNHRFKVLFHVSCAHCALARGAKSPHQWITRRITETEIRS